MKEYIVILILTGLIVSTMPLLMGFTMSRKLNYSMLALLAGCIIYALPIKEYLPNPNPLAHPDTGLRIFELAVIISLIGTGLKIDKRPNFKNYKVPLQLVFITMMLCIGSVAFLGYAAGLPLASALLLGAVIAPTDPVIADDIQVDFDENQEEEDPVRFNLTAEAGLNDGMAFPFTWFAISAALYGGIQGDWVGEWIWKDLLYRIACGLFMGVLVGKFAGWVFMNKLEYVIVSKGKMKFIAVGICFLVYGITELLHGYGFISAFVCGVTIRHYQIDHHFHGEMTELIEQLEKFVLAFLLVLLGGYLMTGLLDHLTYRGALLALVFIFVLRPLFGYLAVATDKLKPKQKGYIGFMGIKGIGSFFYLAFAFHEASFENKEELWATVGFMVIISVIVHGYFSRKVKKAVSTVETDHP